MVQRTNRSCLPRARKKSSKDVTLLRAFIVRQSTVFPVIFAVYEEFTCSARSAALPAKTNCELPNESSAMER
jgi:hypothetical protein